MPYKYNLYIKRYSKLFKKEGVSSMTKYVMLNINSILNNVRNYLADIFFCCYKIKNIVMTKEQYSVND